MSKIADTFNAMRKADEAWWRELDRIYGREMRCDVKSHPDRSRATPDLSALCESYVACRDAYVAAIREEKGQVKETTGKEDSNAK